MNVIDKIMGSDGMNYGMNWIQQDDFNLLHNMRDANCM